MSDEWLAFLLGAFLVAMAFVAITAATPYPFPNHHTLACEFAGYDVAVMSGDGAIYCANTENLVLFTPAAP
jgi:hypothetical protein